MSQIDTQIYIQTKDKEVFKELSDVLKDYVTCNEKDMSIYSADSSIYFDAMEEAFEILESKGKNTSYALATLTDWNTDPFYQIYTYFGDKKTSIYWNEDCDDIPTSLEEVDDFAVSIFLGTFPDGIEDVTDKDRQAYLDSLKKPFNKDFEEISEACRDFPFGKKEILKWLKKYYPIISDDERTFLEKF